MNKVIEILMVEINVRLCLLLHILLCVREVQVRKLSGVMMKTHLRLAMLNHNIRIHLFERVCM